MKNPRYTYTEREEEEKKGDWKRFDALLDVVESQLHHLNAPVIPREVVSGLVFRFKIGRDDHNNKGKKPICLAPEKILIKHKKTKMLNRKNNEIRRAPTLLPVHEPQMPIGIQRKIAELAGVPVWIGYKKLYVTDLNRNHSRLFLPKKVMEVLSEGEKSELMKKDNPGSMNVNMVDPTVSEWRDLQFRIWPSLMQPVLIKHWIELARFNELKEGDVMQIWTFRISAQINKLCFAFNVRKS